MAIAPPSEETATPATGGGRRTTGVMVQLSRYGPIAVGYAVFQSLVGVLPQEMSGDAARYALAGCAGLSVAVVTRLSTLVIRRRADPAAQPGVDGRVRPAAAAGPGRMELLMDGTTRSLAQSRSTVDHPDLGRLVGWPHFLEGGEAGEQPTALSTAYGLHICRLLSRVDGRLDPPALADTLWRLRKADGGWAARTGAGVSRPEITALVVGALSQAGADPAQLRDTLDALERMTAPGVDPQGMSRTYVVCAVVRGLLRATPDSPVLPRLRGELTAGAVRDGAHDDLLCWGHSLDAAAGPRRAGPSTAHTAHAVIALARLERALGPDRQARQAMNQGAQWLVRSGRLSHQTEHLRRLDPVHGTDNLVVRHFTAALVAKALMSLPPPDPAGPVRPPQPPGNRPPSFAESRQAHLAAAIGRVWDSQQDGVWEWDDDRERRPVWMTYQGLSVLTTHALHSYRPAE